MRVNHIQHSMMKSLLVVTGLLAAAPYCAAQFGGREGEAVLFMLTSKGKAGLTLTGPTATNTAAAAARFEVLDVAKVPLAAEQPGIFFPTYALQILHDEPDDKMQVLTNKLGLPTLHHLYLVTFKLFTFMGLRREYGDEGEAVMDVPPNVFASFYEGQDIGPNEALELEQALVWTSKPSFPPFVPTPRNFHGSLNGPNKTGTQLLLDSATFPVLVPWVPVRKKYPSQPWPDGFDIKFIEEDTTMGSIGQMIRVHVGGKVPNFRIDGNTHLLLVQGNIDVTLAGARTVPMKTLNYAFLPSGVSISINNPRTYDGPTAGK